MENTLDEINCRLHNTELKLSNFENTVSLRLILYKLEFPENDTRLMQVKSPEISGIFLNKQ